MHGEAHSFHAHAIHILTEGSRSDTKRDVNPAPWALSPTEAVGWGSRGGAALGRWSLMRIGDRKLQ